MTQTATLTEKGYQTTDFASPHVGGFVSLCEEENFPNCIVQAITTCFCDGQMEIAAVAKMADVSVRTLQRKLAMAGLTYTDLVGRARYEAAVQELENSNARIIDIAYDLGYVDPSNFSRAFRRMAGASPLQFRLSCQES
jgi:AraC-like DNA-binding protein